MHGIVIFAQAGVWFAVLAAWGVNHKRLIAWLVTRLAPIVFITGPGKAARLVFRLTACVFFYFTLSTVFDGVRMAKFERIAAIVASSAATPETVERD